MKKHFSFFAIAAYLVFAAACNNELPELQPNGLYDINIIGQITSLKTVHKVFIQIPEFVSGEYVPNIYSQSIKEVEIKLKPVTDAKVYITDGAQIFAMQPGKTAGYFETTDSVAGEAGKVYTLVIDYKGKTYTASDSMVKAEEFTINDIKSFVKHQIGDETFPEHTTFMFARYSFGHKTNNSWFITFAQPANRVLDLSDYNHYQGTSYVHTFRGITPQALMEGASFNSGMGVPNDSEMNIYKLSVSEKRNAYLRAVFSETEWKLSNFVSIPGAIPSNLSSGAMGFLTASHVVRLDVPASELAEKLNKVKY